MFNNHQHLIVNGYLYKDSQFVEEYDSYDTVLKTEKALRDLVLEVGMKIFLDPVVKVCTESGNEGITGVVGLETSHASVHIWTDRTFRFDLYSCREFDTYDVIKFLGENFDLHSGCYMLIDRNSDYHFTDFTVRAFD